MAAIDPGAITLIQNTFLHQISVGFAIVGKYADRLFYLFAALEIALLGFFWAFSSQGPSGGLILKILKIGLIIYILKEYNGLINVIFKSFTQIAGEASNGEAAPNYITNPALLWQYGYDSAIFLIKSATQTPIIGLALTQLSLGIGILLVFALLGIQIVLYYVGFYVVAFVALIFIPISVFTSTGAVLNKTIYSILQAGIRLMVAMIISAIAVAFWEKFELNTPGQVFSDLSSINQMLGLLFSGLAFLALARYLPPLAAKTIDSIINTGTSDNESSPSVQAPAVSVSAASSSPATVPSMQVATQIDNQAAPFPAGMGAAAQLSSGENASTVVSPLAPSASVTQVSTGSSGASAQSVAQSGRLSEAAAFKASALNKGLTELNKTLKSLAQKDRS